MDARRGSRSSEECLTDSLEDIPSLSSRSEAASLRDLRHDGVMRHVDMTMSLVSPRDCKGSQPRIQRSASLNMVLRPRPAHRASLPARYACSGQRATPSENKTSRIRRQLSHENHAKHGESCFCTAEYLTPLQRKDKQIRELREQIKTLQANILQQQNLVASLMNEHHVKDNVKNSGFQPIRQSPIPSPDVAVHCDGCSHPNGDNTSMPDAKVLPLADSDNLIGYHDGDLYVEQSMQRNGDDIVTMTAELQDLRLSHERLAMTHESTVETLRQVQESLINLQVSMTNKIQNNLVYDTITLFGPISMCQHPTKDIKNQEILFAHFSTFTTNYLSCQQTSACSLCYTERSYARKTLLVMTCIFVSYFIACLSREPPYMCSKLILGRNGGERT